MAASQWDQVMAESLLRFPPTDQAMWRAPGDVLHLQAAAYTA